MSEKEPVRVAGTFELPLEARSYSYDDLYAAWEAGQADGVRSSSRLLSAYSLQKPDFNAWLKEYKSRSR
jgi:hypothetical protein